MPFDCEKNTKVVAFFQVISENTAQVNYRLSPIHWTSAPFPPYRPLINILLFFFRWRGTQYKPAANTIDGLRNVHYRLVQKKVYKFYSHFIIDINAPKRLHTPDMPSNPFSVKYLDEYKMSMEKYWDKIPLFHEQLQQ